MKWEYNITFEDEKLEDVINTVVQCINIIGNLRDGAADNWEDELKQIETELEDVLTKMENYYERCEEYENDRYDY